MTIGFFHPTNQIAVDIITLLERFSSDGHKVIFITIAEKGALHQKLENKGILFEFLDSSKINKWNFYIKNGFNLYKICKKHKIQILYNNLGETQIIALFSKLYNKTPFIYYRHHSDNIILNGNSKQKKIEWFLNTFSKHILVPSEKCVEIMTKKQHIPLKKITHINLSTSISHYSFNSELTDSIKQKSENKLILISIGRLIKGKRVNLQIQIADKLRNLGIPFYLYILGTGDQSEIIKQLITEKKLNDFCCLTGFITDIIPYINASDILIHTSNSEASSQVVKETGLLKKVVICCNDVGDFNEYLINQENAFLVNKDNPVDEMTEIINLIYRKKININEMGNNLFQKINSRFNIDIIIKDHYKLINVILQKEIVK